MFAQIASTLIAGFVFLIAPALALALVSEPALSKLSVPTNIQTNLTLVAAEQCILKRGNNLDIKWEQKFPS